MSKNKKRRELVFNNLKKFWVRLIKKLYECEYIFFTIRVDKVSIDIRQCKNCQTVERFNDKTGKWDIVTLVNKKAYLIF